MSEELQELKMHGWDGKEMIATIGADVIITDRYNSYFGTVVKITSGWGGTIYVQSRSGQTQKFDSSGVLRDNDSYSSVRMAIKTPEEKTAIIERWKKAAEIKALTGKLQGIKWEELAHEQITSVYDLAKSLGIIKN